jgi:hypothetical protein
MNKLDQEISFKDYRAIKSAVSISELNVFRNLPAKYEHEVLLGNKKQSTDAQKIGTSLHAAFLEPAEFFKWYKFAEKLDKRTNVGKLQAAEREEQEALGYVYLNQFEMDKVNSAVRAMHQNTAIKNICKDLTVETSMFWTDSLTGLECKGRMDGYNEAGKFIIDVKTTKDAKNFVSSIIEYGYHRQAAYYMDGLSICLKDDSPWEYYWVVVEMEAPYINAVYKASSNMLEIGRIEYENDLMRFAECKKNNKWPGLENQVYTASLPNWYINKAAEIKT